jgi:hypothetical protein
MHRRRFAAATPLWFAAASATAQPSLDNFDALRVSAEITGLLARRETDAAAEMAARLMEGTSAEKLKGVFQVVNGLGQSQYADVVYARDYGRSEKDVIYKIDFDKAFLFVRYLFHIDHGAWRLIHIHLNTENELPFPKEWVHIYPK